MSILQATVAWLGAVRNWFAQPILSNERLMLLRIMAELKKLEVKMSEISDGIKAASDALSGLKDQITGLGTDLTQEIKEINDKLAAGTGVTPEDLAGLTALAQGVTDAGTSIQAVRDQVKAIIP